MDTRISATSPSVEFSNFMRAYQDMVYSTVVRIIDSDAQAQGISQEVFLKAFENFTQLRDSATAGGWLKTVARNLALNHITRYRRRWRLFSELRRSGDDDDAPEAQFAVADTLLSSVQADIRHERVERALQRLPQHRRLALVLYHFEDMPYEQIARQLHVSVAKVKVDIHRARAALAKMLATSGLADANGDV